MSTQNNLTDFLTAVADSIRAKKETSALINPQDFPTEIASIPSGSSLGYNVTWAVPLKNRPTRPRMDTR